MAYFMDRVRSARWVAVSMFLLCVALCWPGAASAAHTSPLCPEQFATVASGGSVTLNITACSDSPLNFADGVVDGPALPQHGTANTRSVGNQWFLDYGHDGSSSPSDVFEFTAGEANGNGGTVRVNITITPANSSIVVAPATLPTLTAGAPFSQALSASGGTAPYSYAVVGGVLPPGITLSGGVLSGTPTQRGAYTFTVRATDATTATVDKNYSGTVQNPSLTLSPASATAIQGVPFSQTLTTNGAVPPVSYLLETGSLPAGLSLSSAGVISGTSTAAAGSYPVTIRATDSSTGTGTYFEVENFTLTLSPAPTVSIAVAPASVSEDGGTPLVYTVTRSAALSSATVVNLTTTGTATSGTDYSGAATSVTIPAGATTASVSILPVFDTAVEGNETVIITVASGAGYTVGSPASATGTIIDTVLPALSINDASITEGNSGTSALTFTVSLSAPAPTGGVSFDIATADGTATAGIDYVNAALTGQIIPAGATTYTFSVLVTGDTLNEADETFFVNVTNVTGATVADGQAVGTILNDDPLPTLSINSVSVIEGNAGTTTAQLTVTLSAVSGQTVTVLYATADGTAESPSDYVSGSGTLTFSPGITTRTVSVLVNGDTLPEPDETFTVTLLGPNGATLGTDTGTVTIVDDDEPVVIAPTVLPAPIVGVPYSTTITATGGNGSYTFSVASGALPAGLSLASTGLLSGTPTAGGTFTVTVRATDGSAAPGPYLATQAYTLTVAPPTLSLAGGALAPATRDVAYSVTVDPASGGTAPYTYGITSGTLPPGLILTSTGTISGTPSALGTFAFDVTATDASTGTGAPYSVTAARSITVADRLPVAGDVTASVGYGAAATPLTLALSEGTATSVDVVTAPSNGTATVTGPTAISYQPAAGFAGTDSFTYTASNATGTSAVATVTVTVANPAITVSSSGTLSAVAGTPYSQTFTWSGGSAPYSGFQVSNLPPGLAITSTTSDSVTVSGTPTQAGSFSLQASATDSSTGAGPFTTAQTFTLSVASPSLTLAPAAGSLPAASAGSAYAVDFSASAGIAPYTYAITSGALPAGLVLDTANGRVAGTPTRTGNFTFSVTATDATSGTAGTVTQSYVLDVGQPGLLLPGGPLPPATRDLAYSVTVDPASGGTAPYTYAITSGALPAGLTLATTGQISGTPTILGTFSFTVTATDSTLGTGSPYSVSAARSITVADRLPVAGDVTASVGYGAAATPLTLALSEGTATSVDVVTAPSNGTATVTGPTAISYQPAAGFAGTDSFTYTASNATGTSAVATVTVTVANPAITVSSSGTLSAVAGTPYSQTFTWSGGSAPYSGFQVSNLPPGLAITSTTSDSVTVSGTPTQAGSFSLQASATDSSTGAGPFTTAQTFTLSVASPSLTLAPAAGSLPAASAGSAYAVDFSASAGIAPYTYTITSGALPAGLVLDTTSGRLAGTPSAVGTFTFSIIATDSTTGAAGTVTQPYILTVSAPVLAVSPQTLPAAVLDSAYQQSLSTTGGTAPYRYAITAGTLPPGIVLGPAGELSGTPTALGTFNATLTVTDSSTGAGAPYGVSAALTLSVADRLPVTADSTASLAYGAAATPLTLALGGGAATSLNVVTPPSNGTATVTGPTAISYQPAAGFAGTDSFTYTASNATGTSAVATVTVTVANPAITVSSSGTLSAVAGTPYSQTFTWSGGSAPYSGFQVSNLPPGLAITSTTSDSVTVSGTPTQAGSFSLQASATDSSTGAGPFTTAQSFTLNITTPSVSLSPAAGELTATTAGAAYAVEFRATGGIAPYAFAVSSGALPAGLLLDSASGRLAGTPTAAGRFTFSITATDSTTGTAATVTQAYALRIDAPTLVVTPETLPEGAFATAYQQQFVTTGGTAPYRYAITAGALPAGLALTPSGTLSGTPTGGGAFAFTVTTTDALGFTGLRAYTVQITQRPDPTRDAEVRGLLSAQADAARRFATSQIDNFQARMQRLHGTSRANGFSNGLSLSAGPQRCEPAVGSLPGSGCDAQRRQPFDQETGLDVPPAAAQSDSQAPLGLWVGGTVRTGRTQGRGGAGGDFSTDGITVGSDLQVARNLAVGVGVGYGRDDTDVGDMGTRSRGQAYTLAMYGSYSPGERLFLDALLGHQLLEYDLRRYVTGNGGFAHARRDGSQWFGSLSLGADLVRGTWLLTPYARLDAAHGTLDAYAERGGDLYALRYGDQDVKTTTGNGGVRLEVRNATPWGAWTPRLRVEYQHDFTGSGVATMQYADLDGVPFYRTTVDGFDRNRWMIGAGLMFDFRRNWGLRIDYRGLIGSGDDRDHGVQVSLDKQL